MIHTEPARTRRRRATRRRMLDAAMELVVAGGLRGLSMHKLAAALDYTPGALYRYFPSKQALLGELVAEIIAHHAAVLREAVDPDMPPLLRVVALTRAYGTLREREPERFGLLASLMAEPSLLLPEAAHAAPALRAMTAALAPLVASLDDAAAAGALRPGDALQRALILFSSLQGLLQLRKQERRLRGIFDTHRLASELVHTLLVGWGAPSDALGDLP